jgi:hypothetical protein
VRESNFREGSKGEAKAKFAEFLFPDGRMNKPTISEVPRQGGLESRRTPARLCPSGLKRHEKQAYLYGSGSFYGGGFSSWKPFRKKAIEMIISS